MSAENWTTLQWLVPSLFHFSLYAKFYNHLISFELHDPLLDRKCECLWHGTTLQAAAAIPVLFNWIRSDPFNWTRTGARRLHFCINLDTFLFFNAMLPCEEKNKTIVPSRQQRWRTSSTRGDCVNVGFLIKCWFEATCHFVVDCNAEWWTEGPLEQWVESPATSR